MATYFVASGGSNTSPYDTWAKAATSLQTALTTASTAGDIVVLQHDGVPNGDKEVSVDTTYTFAANITFVTASNDGGSAYTLTTQGTSNWIGNSTTNRSITLAGAFNVHIYGLTVRNAGSTQDGISLCTTAGAQFEYSSCYIWHGNASSNSTARIFVGSGDSPCFVRLKDCTLRFGNAAQRCAVSGRLEMIGGSVSSDGTAPTSGLFSFSVTDPGGCTVSAHGVDLSALGSNSIVSNATLAAGTVILDRCKLGSNAVVLDTQTFGNLAGAEAYVMDCSSGDVHGLFGYHNALGSVVSDTAIYYSTAPDSVQDGATAKKQSWKITTTANCQRDAPFITPWIPFYNSATSAITPYIECLRDGNSTAYTNAEVRAEFALKTTSGSTKASFATDWAGLLASGSAQADGAGTGSWTGESGTAKSFKCDSGSSVTPAEVGDISGRLCVAVASISGTLYADPQIRT
jgi:hypothetical protein